MAAPSTTTPDRPHDESQPCSSPQAGDPPGDRPILIDLMCGGGGCSAGYVRAGFQVIGIDIEPHPRYPWNLIQADAFQVLERLLNGDQWDGLTLDRIAAIHASPLCKKHTSLAVLHPDRDYPDQITPLRPLLEATGRPWVIENVVGSPLIDPVLLCGSMFDPPLDVRRHRLFETNWNLPAHHWPCRHQLWTPRFQPEHSGMKQRGRLSRVVGVYGGGRYAGSDRLREQAMEIDWMTRKELTQAIPPAYTEWIGQHLLAEVHRRHLLAEVDRG